MRVIVIGGGIGGIAAARGLLSLGHEVEVFEQAAQGRTSGSALTVFCNGTGVLGDLGVSLVGLGAGLDTLEQRSFTGQPLMRIDLARATRRYGSPNLCVPRRDLAERLAEGLPGDLVSDGRACTGVTHDEGGVQVSFADGSTATGDLLVGADGHRSVVRTGLLGDEQPRATGWGTWQGLITMPHRLDVGGTDLVHVGPEGVSGMFPVGGDQLQWWFDRRWHPADPPPVSAVADLRDRFGHWADPVTRVLGAISDEGIGFFGHYKHRVPRVWGQGRCTLVGDAAHLMPPTMGQGANQALEDAWLLTRTLEHTSDIPAALRRYEHTRSRTVARVSWAAGTEMTNKYQPLQTRLMPDRLATAAYGRWLGAISDYLT